MATDKKITFYEKSPRSCPVCGQEFYHEQILTGGGRLIAGSLRKDLRRLYEKTKKYGAVYPLIYSIVVCPQCLYASFSEDFNNISGTEATEALNDKSSREKNMHALFGFHVDFNQNRTLLSGAASYFLAITSYYWHKGISFPTFKKALASLRLSWVLEDLASENNTENFDALIPLFQYKTKEFYNSSIDLMSTDKETTDNLKSFGPDLDKNYGFEGMLYMAALLSSTFSFFIEEPQARGKELLQAKRKLSKIFGAGKSSKSKPSVLLDLVKELYTDINQQLEKLSSETGTKFE